METDKLSNAQFDAKEKSGFKAFLQSKQTLNSTVVHSRNSIIT